MTCGLVHSLKRHQRVTSGPRRTNLRVADCRGSSRKNYKKHLPQSFHGALISCFLCLCVLSRCCEISRFSRRVKHLIEVNYLETVATMSVRLQCVMARKLGQRTSFLKRFCSSRSGLLKDGTHFMTDKTLTQNLESNHNLLPDNCPPDCHCALFVLVILSRKDEMQFIVRNSSGILAN